METEIIEIFEVIGSICAILSVIILTYIWVYKLGRIIERVDMTWTSHQKLEGIVPKIEVMWDNYKVSSIFAAVRQELTQKHSLYEITEKGKKLLDDKVKILINDFANNNKKLKDKLDKEIVDKFILSSEFKDIKKLIIDNNDTDTKAFFGLVFAYTIEKIKTPN